MVVFCKNRSLSARDIEFLLKNIIINSMFLHYLMNFEFLS